MFTNRRKFLVTTGLAAGGAVLSGLQLEAAGNSASVAEREVSAVISRYGRRLRIRRASGHSTEFKVKVHCPRRFAKVFDPQHLPFERIYVGPENTLKFKHRGVDFKIVNLA